MSLKGCQNTPAIDTGGSDVQGHDSRGPASKKTCENAKVEVKGSGVATCSGNGCSNLASGYPKRRLDAAA